MPARVANAIPSPIVREHQAYLASLLAEQDFAAAILFDPANLLAFVGTSHGPWDRLTCGAITREGAGVLVCPSFERPTVRGADAHATIHECRETEDAFARFATALAQAGVRGGRVLLDERMWLTAREALAAALPHVELQTDPGLLREVRVCKSAAELNCMDAAQRDGERLYQLLTELVRPGVSELAIYGAARERMARDGIAIDPMVQSGPNSAIPHQLTGDRLLQEGDTVVIDSVVNRDGYFNDLTRTFTLGEIGSRAKRAYQAVRDAQEAAIAAARPGIECRELDAIARNIITQAGFGEFFTHRLGHGLGLEIHEPPYLNGANAERLRVGMCMTIEPGVYVPSEFGIRIEDDIVITENGCRRLGALATDVPPNHLLSRAL